MICNQELQKLGQIDPQCCICFFFCNLRSCCILIYCMLSYCMLSYYILSYYILSTCDDDGDVNDDNMMLKMKFIMNDTKKNGWCLQDLTHAWLTYKQTNKQNNGWTNTAYYTYAKYHLKNKPNRATMRPDCVHACNYHVTYMWTKQMDKQTGDTTEL